MDIPIGCSGRHLELGKQWRVGARRNVYQASGREKEKLGRGRGRGKKVYLSFPALHPLRHSRIAFSHRILAPILPVCNESKMAAKLSKDENHQNLLHCRLRKNEIGKESLISFHFPVITFTGNEPGGRFSKAPETFRARKAIFRSSVSENGEVYTPETSCMKGTSLHL